MSDKLEIQRRQEEELKALKAIFGDEVVEDCRLKSNESLIFNFNSWRPVEVQIKVIPHGNDKHVSVVLFISCGPNYPDTTPQELKIIQSQGLPSNLKQELLDKLQIVAYKKKGSEAIYSLIDCTQDFLTEHNEPSPISFYDEMVNNRRRLAEEEEKRRQREINMAKLRDETTSKQIAEEIQRKQLVLRQESRLRRESCIDDIIPSSPRRTWHFHDISDSFSSKNMQSVCSGHKPVHLKLESTKESKELSLIRANCVFHDSWDGSTHYLAIEEDSGNNYLLTEWLVNLKNTELSPSSVYNTLKSCEKEIIKSVMNLTHSNLVIPLSFGFGMEKERSCLRLLNPYVNGCRLCDLPSLMRGEKLDEVNIKKWMMDILEGLIYLHSQDITHGDLRDTVIIIDSRDGLCKLSNFFVGVKIRKLQYTLSSSSLSPSPSPSSFSSAHGFSELKAVETTEDTDIYRFGLLLLWFSTGWSDSFIHLCSMTCNELLNNYITCYDISMEISDLISKCLRVNIFNDIEEIKCHSFFYQPGRSRSNTETRSPIVHHSSRRSATHVIPPTNDNELKDEESEKSSKLWLTNLMTSIEPGHSRLTDYEILCKLGSGGFGEVYKVRNKLDQCYYALKKIPINASNTSINRKIIHEVKYLSRLNHENVVRYYGTWVESESRRKTSDSDSSDKNSDTTLVKSSPPGNDKETTDEESSDEDYSDGELFSSSALIKKVSASLSESYIVYEKQSGDETINDNQSITIQQEPKDSQLQQGQRRKKKPQYNHVMYIQMELCEKNTLRNAIDSSGLCNNPSRRRRLFREIVEGLVHIHEHSIIHRDLKPGNIFLDSMNHVKIGDFGLATRSEICPSGDLSDSLEIVRGAHGTFNESRQTGLVGTFLYMAPELRSKRPSDMVSSSKLIYTQKVDIYSLGIILFEMCYPPTTTKSERVKILTNLREPEVLMPNDVQEHLSSEEIKLMKVLLHHDAAERPTSAELLNSPYLPPPQIEEEEQKNVIREVITNPQSKTHHYMLNLLFQRESDVIEDYVYDCSEEMTSRDPYKRAFTNPSTKQRVFEFVTSTLEEIFQKYGAARFSVATFMPYLSAQKYKTEDVFRVMDGTGFVICPPYDLRVPFARYVAHNRITNLRRYSIEKVFRGRKMSYHPREIYECAFDIVSSSVKSSQPNSATIIPDLEVLNVLNDILHEFTCFKGKSFILRLNHVDLIRGLLVYYEVPAEKQSLAMEIIAESAVKSQKFTSYTRDPTEEEGSTPVTNPSRSYLYKKFRKEGITKARQLNNLTIILEQEKDSVENLKTSLTNYLRKKQPYHLKGLEMVMKAIQEMEQIIENLVSCNNFSVKLRFSPSMINRYYSGLIFQLEEEVNSRKNYRNILALGGRYDHLIKEFQIQANIDDDGGKSGTSYRAIGLSLGVEQIVRFVIEEEINLSTNSAGICDVILWSTDCERSIINDMNRIAKELRSAGVRTIPFSEDSFSSVDTLNSYCEENRVKYSIVLDKINENHNQKDVCSVRIFHIDREKRISEKRSGKISTNELIESMKLFLGLKEINSIAVTSEGHQRLENSLKSNWSGPLEGLGPINSAQINLSSFANIRFYPIDSKSLLNHRKRFTNSINSLLSASISSISGYNNSTLDVFALELPYKIVKSIASDLDLGDSNNQSNNKLIFDQSCKQISEKHPRHRAYIMDVLDHIYSSRNEKRTSIITLVAYKENKIIIFT